MISLLTPSSAMRLFLGIFAVGMAITALIVVSDQGIPDGMPSVPELIRFIGYSVSVSTCLVVAAGHHSVVDLALRRIPFLARFVPNLNGTYSLRTSSNWPLKKAMIDAYSGEATSTLKDAGEVDELHDFDGTIEMRMGLFQLQILYKPDERGASRSDSQVVSATLTKNLHSGGYELFYIYRARVMEPSATDEQSFLGAAALTFSIDHGKLTDLTGHYWTNRSWRKGLNTSGIANMNKVT